MIEINLVPDIKQEYLRTRRMQGRVISFSILASVVACGVVVALLAYMGTQAIRNALADNDTKDQYAKLTSNKDIGKIVTLQNQLATVPDLNNSKQVTSRLFNVLQAINPKAPNTVKMSMVQIDPSAHTLTIEGTANDGFNAADAFKKTILNTNVKYTTVTDPKSDSDWQKKPLATEVNIGEMSYGADSAGVKVLRFKLSFEYPEELMKNSTTSVTVESPTGTMDVTDSHLGVPASLFTQPATDIKEGN